MRNARTPSNAFDLQCVDLITHAAQFVSPKGLLNVDFVMLCLNGEAKVDSHE